MDSCLIQESINIVSNTWNKYGDAEPYWSVITEPKYHGVILNDEAEKDFYNSGLGDIVYIVDKFI